MPEAVINALVQAGILGPVLVALGVYLRQRDRENAEIVKALQTKLDETQAKRVEDAQRVAATLLELNNRWQTVMGESTKTTIEMGQTLERIRETLDKVWERTHLPRT